MYAAHDDVSAAADDDFAIQPARPSLYGPDVFELPFELSGWTPIGPPPKKLRALISHLVDVYLGEQSDGGPLRLFLNHASQRFVFGPSSRHSARRSSISASGNSHSLARSSPCSRSCLHTCSPGPPYLDGRRVVEVRDGCAELVWDWGWAPLQCLGQLPKCSSSLRPTLPYGSGSERVYGDSRVDAQLQTKGRTSYLGCFATWLSSTVIIRSIHCGPCLPLRIDNGTGVDSRSLAFALSKSNTARVPANRKRQRPSRRMHHRYRSIAAGDERLLRWVSGRFYSSFKRSSLTQARSSLGVGRDSRTPLSRISTRPSSRSSRLPVFFRLEHPTHTYLDPSHSVAHACSSFGTVDSRSWEELGC